MNSNKAAIARACRGPLLLMTIGALFAIQQAGGFSFGRTWPLLIIVFGLAKLVERVLLPQNASIPPAYPQAQPYQPPFTQPPGGTPR